LTLANRVRPHAWALHPPRIPRKTLAQSRAVQRVGEPMAQERDRGNAMAQSDKRKQSLYFPESMLQEIQQEAARLDRSLSWVMQRAWKIARAEIRKLPSVNDVPDDGEDVRGLEED